MASKATRNKQLLSDSAKSKLKIVVPLVLVVLLAAGVAVGVFNVGRVEKQHVVGNTKASTEAVLEAAAVKRGSPLFTATSSAINKRVVAKQPWVSKAEVIKRWPSTLEFHVTERVPVAQLVTDDKRWALVSNDGVVLEVVAKQAPAFPLVMDETVAPTPGAKANDRAMKLISMVDHLPDSLRPKVVQLQLRGDSDGYLGLNSGPIVELGPIDQELGSKLTAAAAVLGKEDNAKIKSLDVRTPRMPLAQPK